jgi:hypothetical protein
MLRMISVLVIGLLPDFFAIASSSQMSPVRVRQKARRIMKISAENAERGPIRLSGFQNANQKNPLASRKQRF